MSSCLGDAQGQQEKHQNSQRIVRRAGKQAVVFANNFSSFVQAYSGIVKIMKGADQHYSGIAYGTLSSLLIVRMFVRICVVFATC